MTESVFKNCCKWMQKNLEWQCQKKGLPAPKAHVAKLPAVKATMGTLREQGAALKAERAARDRARQPVPQPPVGGRRSRPRQPSARALESYDAAPPALSRARSAPTPRAVGLRVELFSLATECLRTSSKTRRVDGVGGAVLRRRRRCAIDARHATSAQAPPPPLPQVSANPAAAFQPLYSGQVRLVDVPQMSLAELRALWAPVPDLQRSASAPVPPPPAMPANFNFDAPVTGGWELPPPDPPGSY